MFPGELSNEKNSFDYRKTNNLFMATASDDEVASLCNVSLTLCLLHRKTLKNGLEPHMLLTFPSVSNGDKEN